MLRTAEGFQYNYTKQLFENQRENDLANISQTELLIFSQNAEHKLKMWSKKVFSLEIFDASSLPQI